MEFSTDFSKDSEGQAAPTSSEEQGPAASTSQPQGDDSLVVQLRKELDEERQKYLYLYAEFDTYKKRTLKERSDLLKYGSESLMKEILQVKDNFERALLVANTSGSDESLSVLKEGLNLIETDLKRALEKFGVKEMAPQGASFDPQIHEAFGEDPQTKEGLVGQVFSKGYWLHGRLLRAARVTVGTKREGTSPAVESTSSSQGKF